MVEPNNSSLPRSPVERLLADARLRLVETGTRNRLVHTPRGGKRARSLPIIEGEGDGLFEALVRASKVMRFVAADKKRELALEDPNSGVKRYVAYDAVPTSLRTTLDEEKLEKRLLAIYRDAKTAEEEQGINILFLAIGFLRWYEDEKSEVLREVPLVLVPVSLMRDLRRSSFDLRCREDDIATNQAIQERLRADFGIVLPELPESEEWLPSEYFASVRETIATKSRWSIDPNGVELGFYSFSKLLMIRDLEPAAWGEKSILKHQFLHGLTEGFNEDPSRSRMTRLSTSSLPHRISSKWSTPTRRRQSWLRRFARAAISSCKGRQAQENRRRSQTSLGPPSTTASRSCLWLRRWPLSTLCIIGFRRSDLGRSACSFTAAAPTSGRCSPKSKRR